MVELSIFLFIFLCGAIFWGMTINTQVTRAKMELLDAKLEAARKGSLYVETIKDYNKLVEKSNKVVAKYNTLNRDYKALEIKLKNRGGVGGGGGASKSQPSAASPFTAEEVRFLRFYLHPDKCSGKTNDLYVKILEMGK